MISRMPESIHSPRNASQEHAASQLVRLIPRMALFVIACATPAFSIQTSAREIADLTRQARAALASGQMEAALESYAKAIRLAPKDAHLRLEMGAALAKTGSLPEAVDSYKQALRIAPHHLPAEIGMAQAYRAVPNFDEAKRILEAAEREHPKAPEPLAMMGDMEIQLQTYDAAIEHLKAAVVLAPANVANRNLLAAAYKGKGDADSALAELQKALTLDPDDALALFLEAEIYDERNQDDLALAGAQKVVTLQPKNPRGRVLLAKILMRTSQGMSPADITKRCSAAVAALQSVVEGQDKDSQTLFLLSRAYRCAGQAELADQTVAAFETSSQNDRSAKENEAQARHLVQQANEAALKNDRAGALDLVQQALAKNPSDGAAYSLLAKIYYSSGEIDQASDAIAKALQRAPYQPDFLYVQGKILQKQGKLDEALTVFTRTTLVNPKESDAYFEMGTIYQQRKNRPRALAAYKKAVELSPDDPDYRRALASITTATPSR